MSKRQQTQRARTLRTNPTEAEQRLWQHLRGKQLHGIKFRRQHSIGRYIVDFVSLAHKLIIEPDGGQHADQASYDAERTAWLESQGFRVLRFWNHEVLQQTIEVLETIERHCRVADTGSSNVSSAGICRYLAT